jgi:hypothetical protein
MFEDLYTYDTPQCVATCVGKYADFENRCYPVSLDSAAVGGAVNDYNAYGNCVQVSTTMSVCDKPISTICPVATPYLMNMNNAATNTRLGFQCVSTCTATISAADTYNVCVCNNGYTVFAPQCAMPPMPLAALPQVPLPSSINFCKFNSVYVATSASAPYTIGSCTACPAYINLVPLTQTPTAGVATCVAACPTGSFINNYYGSLQCMPYCQNAVKASNTANVVAGANTVMPLASALLASDNITCLPFVNAYNQPVAQICPHWARFYNISGYYFTTA